MNSHPSEPLNLFRSTLARLTPYNAGKSLGAVAHNAIGKERAKLNSNENPYGLLPGVEEQIICAIPNLFMYPDSEAVALRAALSKRLGVAANRLSFGNGSEDLLSVICRAVIEDGDRVVTLYPSFPLHEDYAQMMGASVERVQVLPDLRIDLGRLVEQARIPAKMLILANPMNPVGSWLDPDQLKQLIECLPPRTMIVFDEAYAEYAWGKSYVSATDLLSQSPNPWIVLRTFSKAWGLAGLRLGFGVCSSPGLCAGLDLVRTPFNTNALAQVAALASLEQEANMRERVAFTNAERDRVADALRAQGFNPARSRGNFLMFDTGEPSVDLAARLLHQGTMIKAWKQPGYETFVRVSIGAPAENDKFLGDLKMVSQRKPS